MEGPALFDPFTLVVDERPHLPELGAGHEEISHLQCAGLDQHRRHRAASLVQLGLDDRSPRHLVGIRLELEHVSLDEDHLEQMFEADLFLCRYFAEDGLPAPFFGGEFELRKFLLDPVRLGLGFIDLVDGYDNRHPGRLGVVDRFARLRHDAVVGGNDEDDDVRHLRAARAHGRERRMTGRVEEGNIPSFEAYLVGADMLGDAAGLLGDHIRLAHRIEERGLSVVHMAHDRDHRRTHHHGLGRHRPFPRGCPRLTRCSRSPP